MFERIRNWSEDRNLISGSNPQAQMVKLIEEMGELASGIARKNTDKSIDSIGDMVVVLTIIAAQLGVTIEDCIEHSCQEIKDRKGKMVDGVFMKENDNG